MFLVDRKPGSETANASVRGTGAVLSSWKEIANFLGCGVRTAQRWERDIKLPVYRLGGGRRGPVCAYPGELSAWLRGNMVSGRPETPNPHREAAMQSRRLMYHSSELVLRTMANSALQRERTIRLLANLERLRNEIRRRSRLVKA